MELSPFTMKTLILIYTHKFWWFQAFLRNIFIYHFMHQRHSKRAGPVGTNPCQLCSLEGHPPQTDGSRTPGPREPCVPSRLRATCPTPTPPRVPQNTLLSATGPQPRFLLLAWPVMASKSGRELHQNFKILCKGYYQESKNTTHRMEENICRL